MTRATRTCWTVLALAAALGLWTAAGHAGGDKEIVWRPFVPADAYKELSQRSVKRIGELASSADKRAVSDLQAEAAILAGYTQSTEAGDAALRGRALNVAALISANKAGEAKKLAADFANAEGKTKPGTVDWRKHLEDLNTVMNLLRPKAKGGEGLPAELQYNPKLKGQNGVEDLVTALAGKKLTDANVGKVAKELPLVAYRVAVIGAITHDYGPPPASKGDAKQWQKLSETMRSSAVALAEAAQKKDGTGIHDAAKRLESSCIECHRVFRN